MFRVDNMTNLLVVGLMEPSMEGAVLSPTFSCLLAKVNAWKLMSSLLGAVLRIRFRDPVPFKPLDPGWVKNQDADPG